MKKVISTAELKPSRQKSYYGKALVKTMDDGSMVLQSYYTDVASFDHGVFSKLWDGYSATTMKHINDFASLCGLHEGGKKWWKGLETSER